jgi:hypothetical protein
MAILNYDAFRELANPGGTLASDGLPEWPVASLRAGGFDDGFDIEPTDSFPLTVTCNAGAADAVDEVDEYDWFVSQGGETAGVGSGHFVVTRATSLDPITLSGSIVLDLTAAAEVLFPAPFSVSSIEVLFFGVDVYVRRKSDGSIQYLDLRRYLYTANAPTTDVE